MKVQLRSLIKSSSLGRIAHALSIALGYKVWRTKNVRHDRKQFLYGDQVNKLAQYKWFKQQGISALEFTTDSAVAGKWIVDGHVVIARHTLTGSQGHGIEICDGNNGVPQHCPVYTKYKPKKREFRVHIFKNTVVTIVEKRRKNNWQGDKKDAKIRNLANGYVFCQDVQLTEALRARIEQVSLAASKVCGSDFRGVDVAYNEKNDDVFVIEVNSAPGIEGSNVQKYIQVMKQYV
jgi:hypothetical protein